MTRPPEPTTAGERAARRTPPLGLRGRLTLVSVLGLAVGLALGGLALLSVLGHVLQRSVDAEAFQTADAVALLAAEDALPDPLPVAAGQVRVQVVDGQGRVRAASIDADRLVPMLPVDRIDHATRQRAFVRGERLGLPGPVRVVSVPAGTPTDPLTVLVGKSMADVNQGAKVVRFVLLVGIPLLVVILGGVTWRGVGATLRPVEALRSGAEEITGRANGGRLPVPASQDEIHRLAVTLNDMLARLEAARARQRAFLANAAHELRSPLTNMRTELEVAGRLGERTDWPVVARDLLADTERLSRLVDDLLLLARLDEAGHAGAVAPARAVRGRRATGPVELTELVRAVAARFPSPPVRVLPASGPQWTVGDPDELHRVVTNLIDNAVRHCRSTVVIEVTAVAAAHLVTVTDDGPGIPAADRERVFDRFTRLDDARDRDAGGAGLGLAIVRELVRLHDGTVRLSDAGPGLRVTVCLPALPDPDA